MQYITLPCKNVPVIDTVDVCVIGGSCTGVFAAVRAARLGARVAIVEKLNAFGGTATAGLVNVWHTLLDADFREPVIGGSVCCVMEMRKRSIMTVLEYGLTLQD